MMQAKNWGLTSAEAREQLARYGYNEVVPRRAFAFLNDLLKIFHDPMGLMLLALGVLYWLLGDRVDSIILFVAFIPVTTVDVVLEIRSSRALKALKETLTPFAKVYRDGIIKEISVREIARGDVIVFEEGQTLPADGVIVDAEGLDVNEAALTGESIPVTKRENDGFFGGATILSGRGLGRVEKTGRDSRYGKIAEALEEAEAVKSPLRKKVDHFVNVIFGAALVFAILLFFIEWWHSREIVSSLIVALTLAMAAVPEEFPLVFTLYLTLGAWRLSKKGLLVKSLPGVEALGGVDVICTDKTGTLTEGNFKFEKFDVLDKTVSETDAWRVTLMACEIHPVDSMEAAIFQNAEPFLNLIRDWALVHDYPFETRGKHMSHVWRNARDRSEMIAMKGAVEGVLEHCDVTNEIRHQINERIEKLASSGKRILGLASRAGSFNGNRDHDENNLNFVGFLVFSDPVRSAVKDAVHQCQAAGIEIKMLTGDHLLTAHAVADQIGLTHFHDKLFTGQMLAQMTEEQRTDAYFNGAIFARVMPEEKLEMVKAIQSHGEVVAMTGDGINDAPALKAADIGISMGTKATDVARSAAQMVLLQNDFTGIVHAVFEGRRIFANLQRSFSYLISFHIPVILLALLPPLLGWPPLLLPVHIIVLELIVHPVSAFTFENILERGLAKNPRGSLLTKRQFISAAIPGLLLSLGALWLFGRNHGASLDAARSLAFETILFGNIFFVAAEVVPRLTRRFYATAFLIALLGFAAVSNTELAKLFHFQKMGLDHLLAPLVVGVAASFLRINSALTKARRGA